MRSLFFLLLLCVVSHGASVRSVSNTTVQVYSRAAGAGRTGLLDALKDDRVQHIVIMPERFNVATELEGMPPKLRVNRNITVTGANGTNTVFDQQFLYAKLELCGNCTWTFRNITVANDRRGSDAANDLFVAAQLGARLVLQDTNVLRLACPTAADSLSVLNITPRSAAFSKGSAQQQHDVRNVSIQGMTFPGSLFARDFSTDVAPSQEGRSHSGGYALHWKDTARACQAYVDSSCLDSKSLDACTVDLINAALAAQQQQGRKSGLTPGALAAAIAVPICLAALAAAGVAAWLCSRSNRSQGPCGGCGVKKGAKPDSPHDCPDVETGSGGPSSDNGGSGGPIRADSYQPLRRPVGLQQGWTVSKTCTTPFLGTVEDDSIDFGELIGSGSFGRVYQAKWAGRDVAVKVIEHNTDTSSTVEREVQLMLSFNHPNIVRAFHFVTRVHNNEGVMPHIIRDSSSEPANSNSAGSRNTPHSHSHSHTSALNSSASDTNNNHNNTNHHHHNNTLGTNPHVAAAAAVARAHRHLPPPSPYRPAVADSASGQTSSGSRCSGISGIERPDVGSSIGNPQLQLAQRLPSLTGGTPRLVHKVETWLVQEYCDCGTLAAVATEWSNEPESDQKMLERLLLLQDCGRGLKELHSRNVVHGDLNTRNVLLSSSAITPLGVVAKLADLGLSRIVRSHRTHHSTNTIGTMSHVAPELLRYGHMSQAGDIYAFGIMMWELYTGQAAFRKLHVGQFFEAIVVRNLRPLIPHGMAADYQLLMQSCWSADPTDRPSVDRLITCLRHMIHERQGRLALSLSQTDYLLHPGLTASAAGSDANLVELSQGSKGSHTMATSAAAVAAAAAAYAGSPPATPYSGPSPAALASLPGLLSLLKERGPQQQQQQLRDAAGGRLFSSCPLDNHRGGSGPNIVPTKAGGQVPAGLHPVNTGRQVSADSDCFMPPWSQSDPLPAFWGGLFANRGNDPPPLVRPVPQRPGATGAFHGFHLSGGRSGDMPTPIMPGSLGSSSGLHSTPLTGVTYQYSSGGTTRVSSSGGSGSGMGSLVRPLGSSNLVRTSSLSTSSLGTSNHHWYWQRSLAPNYACDETASVTDQDAAPAGHADEQQQPQCADVMAALQRDNNWYV